MTTTLAPPARSTAESLVLVRLALPSRKPPSASDVRGDVAKVTGTPLTADEYAGLTASLLANGLVEPRPRSRGGVRLTEAGRSAALTYLGLNAIPPRTNWKTVRAKYLLARALGPGAGRLDSADRLGGFLIRREYGLDAGGTVRQALEALVCKLVGRPGESTLDGLFRTVLSDELRSDERLAAADLLKQFPRRLAGAKTGNLDDLRAAVVARWLREAGAQAEALEPGSGGRDAESEPLDLAAFAATALRVARDCPPGSRFGGDKVFAAAAWRASQAQDGFPRMTLAEFKAALADASRAGLIRLEPADLVQAMDHEMVSDSEIVRAGAAFHFILVEEPAP
jgi:hypothetical protein